MNKILKILLIFAFFSASIPFQETFDSAQQNFAEHNCCGESSKENESHDTCTPLCQCFSNPTLLNISLVNLSLEVKFTHYQTHINKFTEGKTEPVFHPPIA